MMIDSGYEETPSVYENISNQCVIQTFNRFYSLMSNLRQLRMQISEEFKTIIRKDLKIGKDDDGQQDNEDDSSTSSFEIFGDEVQKMQGQNPERTQKILE